MSGKALAFTERDGAVVREITRFGVMSREQLMRLRFFASKTRANERLKRLVDVGHLAARRQPLPVGGPRHVYLPGTLSADGRDGRTRFANSSDLFLAHQLGLVDIRLAFEQNVTLTRWLPEKDLAGLLLGLVPDAYLECEVQALTFCAFVEYDRGTETLGRVERKVRAYLDLAHNGRFERTFRRKYFRVLMVADTVGRLATLSQTTARLTDRVLRFTTVDDITHRGPLASIWRRPGANRFESLTGS
jgi:Replication-relaxation